MQTAPDLKSNENRVFAVETKEYKSMMVTQNEIMLIGKRVTDPSEFWQHFEKQGLLSTKVSIGTDKIKSFVLEQGEKKISITYTKKLMLGVPGEFELPNQEDLDAFLWYLENQWHLKRTDKALTPLKATLPYAVGLLVTIGLTLFILYVNIYGFEGRINVIIILMIKLGEKIGPVGILGLGAIIMFMVSRALWGAYKNPPIETRLEHSI